MTVDEQTLRRLAGLRTGRPMISLFLDLDPSQFATADARSSAARSLLAEARRQVEDGAGERSHDDQAGLRAGVERLERFFGSTEFSAEGARALAVFCSAPDDLLEAVKLGRPVESRAVVDDSPYVEPLVSCSAGGDGWCVLLVNRRVARILRGSAERLEEVGGRHDDTHGQHDQGGWSQARYERSVEEEAEAHVRESLRDLHHEWKRRRFDHLLVGATAELMPWVERHLHGDLAPLLRGRIDVDVENSSSGDVRAAAAAAFEEVDRGAERRLLDRIRQELGRGARAAAGLDDVLAALTEQRVEALAYERGFDAPGVACPSCGWLAATGERCPSDGTPLDHRDGIVETAVERALAQSAQVVVVRHHDDLARHERIAAVLRF